MFNLQSVTTYSGDVFNYIDFMPYYVFNAIPTVDKVSSKDEALKLISGINSEDREDYYTLNNYLFKFLAFNVPSTEFIHESEFDRGTINDISNRIKNTETFTQPNVDVLKPESTYLDIYRKHMFSCNIIDIEYMKYSPVRLNNIFNSLLPEDNKLKLLKECYDLKFVRYRTGNDNSLLGVIVVIKEGFGSYFRNFTDVRSGCELFKDIYIQSLSNFNKDIVINSPFFFHYINYFNKVNEIKQKKYL